MSITELDGGNVAGDSALTPMTTTDPSVETWGATPQDVKDLLPHVTFAAPAAASNPHYTQGTTAPLTDDTLQRFIEKAAMRVSIRLRNYDAVPVDARPLLREAARDAVATGAAHYAQAALYPAASSPNDGDAYADRLWERFQDALASAATLAADEAADGAAGAGGGITFSFPAPIFHDGWAG